jgi:hypothetical protein
MKTKKRKAGFNYPYVTAGEALYGKLRHWLFSDVASDHMQDWLGKIEFYAEELREFLEQATALWLTARLISVGRSLQTEYGTLYRDELRPFLKEYLVMKRDELTDFERLLESSVEASLQQMTDSQKKQLLKFSTAQHPYCYICGVDLDFTQQDEHAAFTREHIWPSSLGGNSTIENLLPACGKCNNRRKMNYATWAATSIQSICVPKKPDDDDWMNLQLSHFYAMHQFAGQSFAIANSVTLKDAFLQIGPWDYPPRSIDKNDVGHFFNLKIV